MVFIVAAGADAAVLAVFIALFIAFTDFMAFAMVKMQQQNVLTHKASASLCVCVSICLSVCVLVCVSMGLSG